MIRLGLIAVLVLAACRTPVAAKPKEAETEKDVYVTKECNITDYPSVGDVPDGSKNLGVVRVAKVKGQSDEETVQALRDAICAKGGDALSSMAWVKSLGKISGPPTELEATAWVLPETHQP
jgi:hypothetical protein